MPIWELIHALRKWQCKSASDGKPVPTNHHLTDVAALTASAASPHCARQKHGRILRNVKRDERTTHARSRNHDAAIVLELWREVEDQNAFPHLRSIVGEDRDADAIAPHIQLLIRCSVQPSDYQFHEHGTPLDRANPRR